MKNIYLIIAFITGISTVAIANNNIEIKSSAISEDRYVKNFNGVASSGFVNVVIKLGDVESLRLEGDPSAIADLITEVKGNVLNIKPKTKVYWNNRFKNAKVTAYITAKRLTNATMSGSGDMRIENSLNNQNFTATVSGSGSIRAKGSFNSFVGVISGSGTIKCSGKSDQANLTISGSGKFSGNDFTAGSASSVISGSGNINMGVNNSLKAVINGSGSFYYTGNPTVEKTTIGSGRVKRV